MTRAGGGAESEVLSRAAVAVFRLNRGFISALDRMALPCGLSAARWQLLSTVAEIPLSVSEAARRVGNTRQSVQRIADQLVREGLAVYQENPAHRRAKLLVATEKGVLARRRVDSSLAELARQVSESLGGGQEMDRTVTVLRALSQALPSLTDGEAP
ncbi:MarR family winged helix-turn-helix transcriptional regulator [Streptomyces sp. NPDC087897]|uniref:MarR family winged helix-turn-helix transcriptional regulator n=1 Tax=Streptomyces sp. NPDC087897 TaxID=3365817 RepID=UPI003814AD1D